MAALFLKSLTLQTIKTKSNCVGRCFGKHMVQKTAPAQLSLIASDPRLSYLIHAKAFSTADDPQDERRKKKENETDFSNIGRKIRERIIHVLDEKGNDLGNMHRADVIRLMDEHNLRLVQRNASAEPPEYQLMTGAQIYQERLRLVERGKASGKEGRYFAVCSLNPVGLQTSSFHCGVAKVHVTVGKEETGKLMASSPFSMSFFLLHPSVVSILFFPLIPCVHYLFL
ncbi:PREDICTED: translation initiation factor IF-3, mitochondrial isoform X1 [Galeopterus variegatus]|uniref:Translation initiation factor IF-3, mitochondrial isoform X1 n=1 Tax=Galeopterus variegatus TaxID=482537 RepID=A0ABM0SFX5_GALVR|nr:PREDICTED: translation initiation factor IF-3, mitochondrial isoform X1 [Galeopterus variegatus]XP_008591767.1 PREDICTED: translation initiation factor IF-3, mitochondrial isoform X1 [Galeopterus variegatus]